MLSTHIDPFTAFVKDLQMYGCEVHLYRGPNSFGYILTPEKDPWNTPTWEYENLYFLAGVKPGLKKRASDSDVLWRTNLTLDFDIRKELEKLSASMLGPHKPDPYHPDSVSDWAEKILASLEHHPLWGNFRYAVLSGNGLHLHYFGEPVEVNKEEWSAGMKDIFAEINAITPIPCDTGCGNAGRIMRMPGSWNVKDPANRKPVDFLCWQTKASLPSLSFVQKRGALALAKQQAKAASERQEFVAKHPEGGSDVISLINSIPIEKVVHQLLGCTIGQVKKDGGLRFVDEKNVERGFFKHKDYNVIIHEGTSLFAEPEDKGYNCLGLVKAVLGVECPEAIDWFCEKSPSVRAAKERERSEWVKQKTAADVAHFEAIISKQNP